MRHLVRPRPGPFLASLSSMNVVALMRRLRDEFAAMPGLRLTEAQVQRLGYASASTSASALRALVSAGFLRALEDGSYQRADMAISSRTHSTGGVPPPWHHILCLVEFEDASHKSVTAASQSALCYATTLAVTQRARVTALHLVPRLPDTAAEQQTLLEQVRQDVRKHALAQTFPGLIDVHVDAGTTNEDLLRSARDIRADLIVLGRGDGGAVDLSQLRKMLREAPYHVLVVRPSGQAAVA